MSTTVSIVKLPTGSGPDSSDRSPLPNKRSGQVGFGKKMKRAIQTILMLLAAVALLLAPGGVAWSVPSQEEARPDCCGDVCPVHCCVEPSNAPVGDSRPFLPAFSSNQEWHAAMPPLLLERYAGNPSLINRGHRPKISASVRRGVPLFLQTHSFLI